MGAQRSSEGATPRLGKKILNEKSLEELNFFFLSSQSKRHQDSQLCTKTLKYS